MLTDVTIEGLRGVGRVELHFAPGQRVYTLFGENGVGKTKCLEALYQFLLTANKDFEQHGRTLQRERFVMARMSAGEATFEIPSESVAGDSFLISSVWKAKDAKWHGVPVVFLGAGHRASLDGQKAPSVNALGTFADRRLKYFQTLQQTINSGHMGRLGMTGDTRAWFLARAQSVNPYQKSRDNRKAELDALLFVLNAIDRRIDPDFLQIDGSGEVSLKVENEERELGALSSGFVALVKLIQAIIEGYAAFTNETQLRNVRGIVLIDEIDSHLHAQWQVRIIPLLKKLLPNTTFYIATHSPLVLSQLLHGEAYLLKRGDDGVVYNSLLKYPDRRNFIDVLEDALSIDLNKLKLDSFDLLGPDEQERIKAQTMQAKERLLQLLEERTEA
jgi:predicted ATPase